MAWTDLSAAFAYGSQLTSQQMQQLRDNIQAMGEGDAGAPEITANALKVGTGVQSGTLDGLDEVNIGGYGYAFFPNIYAENPITIEPLLSLIADYTGRFRLKSVTGTNDYWVAWHYVTASGEPYIFMLIDKNNKIKHMILDAEPNKKYWQLDDVPDDFQWPFKPKNSKELRAVTIFKFKQYQELKEEFESRGIPLHNLLNSEYVFDNSEKIFKRKNLSQI